MMKRYFFLLIMLIPLVYSHDFCAEGNDLEIDSIFDRLYDNDIVWNWKWGENIEIEVIVESYLDDDENFTARLYFLDESGELINITENEDDIEKTFQLDENETDSILFDFKLEDGVQRSSITLHVEIMSLSKRFCTSAPLDKKILIDESGSEIAITNVYGDNEAFADSNGTYTVTIENWRNKVEKKIKVVAANYAWRIYNEQLVYNLTPLSSKNITFNLHFPQNAEGAKTIYFYAYYNYDEKKEIYKSSTTEDGFDKRYVIEIVNKTLGPYYLPENNSIANPSSPLPQDEEPILAEETKNSSEENLEGINPGESKKSMFSYIFWIFLEVLGVVAVIVVIIGVITARKIFLQSRSGYSFGN